MNLSTLLPHKRSMVSVYNKATHATAAEPAWREVDVSTLPLGGSEIPLSRNLDLESMSVTSSAPSLCQSTRDIDIRQADVFQRCAGIRHFETLDLTENGEGIEPSFVESLIQEHDIIDWARFPASPPNPHTFRFKMLIGQMLDHQKNEMAKPTREAAEHSRHVLREAINSLGLKPDILDSYFKGYADFSFWLASASQKDIVYCQDLVSGVLTIGWRYFPKENCATALLLYKGDSCNSILQELKLNLKLHACHIRKPLLLGFIGTLIRFGQTCWQLEQIKKDVREAESKIGYTFLGEQHQPDSLKLDSVAKGDMDLTGISKVNKQMAGVCINAHRRLKQMELDSQSMLNFGPCDELKTLLMNLVQKIRSRILFAEGSIRRADIQNQELDDLHNRLNQDSANRIAEAAWRDNYSVKTLAILTMVFLPGTFLAAIFTSSLLDWNPAPGQSHFTSGFWVYIAITVPVTVAIGAIWWLLVKHYTRKNHRHRRFVIQRLRKSKDVTQTSLSTYSGHVKTSDIQNAETKSEMKPPSRKDSWKIDLEASYYRRPNTLTCLLSENTPAGHDLGWSF